MDHNEATYRVVKGYRGVSCLEIKTPTGRFDSAGNPVDCVTRIYFGNLRKEKIGCDAHTLGFEDLILGRVIEVSDPTGEESFKVVLRYAQEYAIVIESDKITARDGMLFFGTKFRVHSDESKGQPFLHPLKGEAYVKVREAGEEKHYTCVPKNREWGQEPEELGMQGNLDFGLLRVQTGLFFQSQDSMYEACMDYTARGGDGFQGGSEHAVVLGESKHTAVQSSKRILAKLQGDESTILVRMVAENPESRQEQAVSASKVGGPPHIQERKTSLQALKKKLEEECLRQEELQKETLLLPLDEDKTLPYEYTNKGTGWNLRITVRQSRHKQMIGNRIPKLKVTQSEDYNRYEVLPDTFINVTLKNLSNDNHICLMPVYLEKENAVEEPEDLIHLEPGGKTIELPCLLKVKGENPDFWLLKDQEGRVRFKLGFALPIDEAP